MMEKNKKSELLQLLEKMHMAQGSLKKKGTAQSGLLPTQFSQKMTVRFARCHTLKMFQRASLT